MTARAEVMAAKASIGTADRNEEESKRDKPPELRRGTPMRLAARRSDQQ
jgi:hypothetical protein